MWKQGCNILFESYTKTVLKRSVSSKKARISLVLLKISSSSRYKSLFNLFFCSVVNLKLFFLNCEIFCCPDFVDSEISIGALTSLINFYKRVHLWFKKQHVSNCQKKISFVQITHLKLTFLTPSNIKSY